MTNPAFGSVSHNIEQGLDDLASMPNYLRWIEDWMAPHLRGRILEIGAGSGNFLTFLRNFGEVSALEPDPVLVEKIKARHTGVTVIAQDVETYLKQGSAAKRFNSIACINTLEHIQDDEALVRGVSDLLEPGGVFLMLVPAHEFLYSSWDRAVGHYRRYTTGRIRMLARSAGLRVASCDFFDLPGMFGWWMNRLAKTTPGSASLSYQMRWYDRVIPYWRKIESGLNGFSGKSLRAVLQKPEAAG